jgi:GNAT superfamily N-acetyltransferase
MSAGLVYDTGYREVRTLRNGEQVLLRTVQPGDKRYLVQGFHRLSPSSRAARFLGAKSRLTDAELAYLTEVDLANHFAIGAVTLRPDGSEGEGVAIGRFVRIPENPESAEPAIVVVDAWQGNGLGRLLLERLIAAALERGVRTFHAEFMAENASIRRLLESVCPGMLLQRSGPVVVATMPLADADATRCDDEPREMLHRLLRLAAQRLLQLKTRER